MLYRADEHAGNDVLLAPPTDSRPLHVDGRSPLDDTSRPDDPSLPDDTSLPGETVLAEAVGHLRALILAGESYRLSAAGAGGLGTTESQAVSYLAVHGARGQSELACDLSLTSSAATALVDRLERHGVAERAPHPSDRRRTLIRLTSRGEELAVAGQQPLRASLGLVDPGDLPLVASWLAVIAGDLHARSR